ncbi:MAG TPA: transferrin-binding protein-like solute binding protein, partial [Allosphingosinicella sp.]
PAASYNSFEATPTASFDVSSVSITAERRINRSQQVASQEVNFSPEGQANGLLTYDAGTKTYRWTNSSLGSSDLNGYSCGGATPFHCYGRDSGGLAERVMVYKSGIAHGSQPSIALTYATFIEVQQVQRAAQQPTKDGDLVSNDRISFGLAGFRTLASDMPKSGTATYASPRTYAQAALSDATASRLLSGHATLTADFGTGNITTQLMLQAFSVPTSPFDTYTGSGSITSGTALFGGNIGNGILTGTFNGAFFGPAAKEMGYTFRMTNGAGDHLAGVVVGYK